MELHGSTQQALIQCIAQEAGEPPFRVSQILDWVYRRGVSEWEEMTNLPKAFRKKISNQLLVNALVLLRTVDSQDRETTKYLWELSDGKRVESVLIRAPNRNTVCVSSQVGCPARCAFCASGREGLVRNLTSAEIVEQVYRIDRLLKEGEERVSHVVFMGMGEPFENYEAVVEAVRLLTDEQRLNISERRITISTVGLVDKILRLADEGLKLNLVLSLHAPNQRIRQKIIPYARKYLLGDLLMAMLRYAEKSRRDITYEYTLIAGLNDKPEHARELALLLKDHPCTVNLIPYNPVLGLRLKRPSKEVIEHFRGILTDSHIPTTWRYTKGKDIAAACGQLAMQKGKASRPVLEPLNSSGLQIVSL